ncbi:MAG: N-acetylmuramoyl-L-alanine amidase [Rhodospirillales bacterium]|nr:N-acetylmuramoyl-L-alanine amidase [Rhodospirillales bacterium]
MAPQRHSPNFDDRPPATPIDMVVIHYTGMESAEAALARLCDAEAKVSAHYVIGEDGAVTSLVEEKHRAWHAGEAFWRGHTDINARSIGIELVNPGHEFGYRDFSEAQMSALEDLAKGVLDRHPIPARNVVGHSDVAPSRKTDPGERFDWAGLAAAGIGLWPEGGEGDADKVGEMLSAFGYDTRDLAAAVSAFQRHFSPESLGSPVDGALADRLKALLDRCNT